jgi:hypothetical protein
MRAALDLRLVPRVQAVQLLAAGLVALVASGGAACDAPASGEGEGEGEGEADVDDPTDPGLPGRVLVVFNTVQPSLCVYDAAGTLLETRESVLAVELAGRVAIVDGVHSLRFTLPIARQDQADPCITTVAGGGRSAPLSVDGAADIENDAGVVVCVEPGGCAFQALTPSLPSTSTVITLDVPLRSCRSLYDEAVEATDGTRTPTVGDGVNRVAVGAFDVGSDVVFLDGDVPAYTMFDVVERAASHHLVACALDRLEQNRTYLVVSTCTSSDGTASALRCGEGRSVIGN